jgi:hypothetical protein
VKLQSQQTLRVPPDEIRRMMRAAGWTEVYPPAPPRRWPWRYALAGAVVGAILVAGLRFCGF